MRVLIVENNPSLGQIWSRHITRLGAMVDIVSSQATAVEELQDAAYDILVLNINLDDGSAVAVADYASYRRPNCKVIFVTSNSFFSDGSIFNYMSNACAYIASGVLPEDMAALVEHHAR